MVISVGFLGFLADAFSIRELQHGHTDWYLYSVCTLCWLVTRVDLSVAMETSSPKKPATTEDDETKV